MLRSFRLFRFLFLISACVSLAHLRLFDNWFDPEHTSERMLKATLFVSAVVASTLAYNAPILPLGLKAKQQTSSSPLGLRMAADRRGFLQIAGVSLLGLANGFLGFLHCAPIAPYAFDYSAQKHGGPDCTLQGNQLQPYQGPTTS